MHSLSARTAFAVTVLAASLQPTASAQERAQLTEHTRSFVSTEAPVVALTNVRLIDGTGAPARDGQTVVIEGGRITAVGPMSSVTVPGGAQLLDLRGHTVLPGLVQLHEHTWFGGIAPGRFNTVVAHLLLANGVTTAMTAGTQFPYHELNLRNAIDTGRWPGPRLHIAGPYITGGVPRPAANALAISEEDIRRVVNYWADEGATWFKVLNGPADALRWTIEAAHARGLKVTIHPCAVSFAEAAALGIDLLQHGFITASEYVPGREPGVCPPGNQRAQADVDVGSEAVQASIRALAARGVPVVSTLSVYETFTPGRNDLSPRVRELMHPAALAESEAYLRSLAAEGGYTVPERLLKKMMQWERDFVAAGGMLGSGSDPWGSGLMPGLGNLRNYELLREAGFSAEEVVRIMTLNGAKILGEDQRVGSVEVGKAADLFVVRGDPVARPAAIYDVVQVFRDGIGYDPVKLLEAARGKVGAP